VVQASVAPVFPGYAESEWLVFRWQSGAKRLTPKAV